MSRGQEPKLPRTPAYEDYLRHKLWLRSCSAVLSAAYADRMKSEDLNDEGQFGLAFDMLTIVEAVDDCLKLADLRMRSRSAREQATVAEMLMHYRRVLNSLPTAARHVEVVERAVRIADESGIEDARDLKAEDDAATLAIAAPFILAALGTARRVTRRDKLLDKVNEALTATKDRKHKPREAVSLRTLSRWIAKVKEDRLTACLTK